MNKLYTKNSHQNFYQDWSYLGNDEERDYYISINSKGNVALSVVHSNESCDYSSPSFEVIKSNPSRYYFSPCKGSKELVKRLASYGHLSCNLVVAIKHCKDTKKDYQLRIDGEVYVDLGCGWFKSLFVSEKDFLAM